MRIRIHKNALYVSSYASEDSMDLRCTKKALEY